mmetsp:Transcript_34464/g.108195  ORF Transcript_34464/g.108195 Transcript_34464/m.108195 type:complete len:432 (-) Transcript_34464:451-1746(-)
MSVRSSKVKPKETAEVWSPGESGRESRSDRELELHNEVARAAGLAAGEGSLSASVACQAKPASSGNLHYELAAPPPLDPAPPEGALTWSPVLGLDATQPPSPPPSPPPTETGKLWHTSRELDKAAAQAEEAEAKMAALRVGNDAVTAERPAKTFGSCGVSSPAELTVSAQEFTAAELRAAGYSKEKLHGAGLLSRQDSKPAASSPSTEAELQAEAEAMRAQLRAARAAKAGGGKSAGGDASKASNNADTRTCAGCGELLFGAAGGEAVEAAGKMWHSDCFVCAACGKPIDGDFAMLHGKPLHTACHLKDYGVHCAGCGRLIDGRADPGFVVAGDKSYHSACFKCAECGVSLATGAPYHLVADAAYCKLHDRRRKITRDKLKVNSTTGEEYYVEADTGRKYRHAPTADGRGGKVLPAVVCSTGLLRGSGFVR